MREAERREAAAVEYANALERKEKLDQERFNKVDSEYNTKFAESVKSEMESVQKQLATAIESGDAAQVQANKRIAELAFEDAKLAKRAYQTSNRMKNLLDFLMVEIYQNKLQHKCQRLTQWLKVGQVKILGLEQTEL